MALMVPGYIKLGPCVDLEGVTALGTNTDGIKQERSSCRILGGWQCSGLFLSLFLLQALERYYGITNPYGVWHYKKELVKHRINVTPESFEVVIHMSLFSLISPSCPTCKQQRGRSLSRSWMIGLEAGKFWKTCWLLFCKM